jgi:hypothetical protein
MGDAVRNGHAGQAGANGERSVPDMGDAVGDGHTGQAGATGERIVSEIGDTVGNGEAAGLATWVMNEPRLQFVEENPIQAAVV